MATTATNGVVSPTLSLPRHTLFFNSYSPFSTSFIPHGLSFPRIPLSYQSGVFRAYPERVNSMTSLMSDMDPDSVPTPIVLIDQDSDPVSTIVQLSFGDRLGALIDTMRALKDLGLDVSKGTVTTEGPVKQTKLFITHLGSGRKVEEPDMLERIRLTIIHNLLKYHPESSERLAMGEAFGVKAPEHKPDVDVATHIHVQEDGPKKSLLYIETADRPGLLMEVIKIMADINITVESAEIDTEGLVAKDKFHVSYGGAALNSSLSQFSKMRHLSSNLKEALVKMHCVALGALFAYGSVSEAHYIWTVKGSQLVLTTKVETGKTHVRERTCLGP